MARSGWWSAASHGATRRPTNATASGNPAKVNSLTIAASVRCQPGSCASRAGDVGGGQQAHLAHAGSLQPTRARRGQRTEGLVGAGAARPARPRAPRSAAPAGRRCGSGRRRRPARGAPPSCRHTGGRPATPAAAPGGPPRSWRRPAPAPARWPRRAGRPRRWRWSARRTRRPRRWRRRRSCRPATAPGRRRRPTRRGAVFPAAPPGTGADPAPAAPAAGCSRGHQARRPRAGGDHHPAGTDHLGQAVCTAMPPPSAERRDGRDASREHRAEAHGGVGQRRRQSRHVNDGMHGYLQGAQSVGPAIRARHRPAPMAASQRDSTPGRRAGRPSGRAGPARRRKSRPRACRADRTRPPGRDRATRSTNADRGPGSDVPAPAAPASRALQVRREHAGRGLRGAGAGRPGVDDPHRDAGLGQLERHCTADDPGADDKDVWLTLRHELTLSARLGAGGWGLGTGA